MSILDVYTQEKPLRLYDGGPLAYIDRIRMFGVVYPDNKVAYTLSLFLNHYNPIVAPWGEFCNYERCYIYVWGDSAKQTLWFRHGDNHEHCAEFELEDLRKVKSLKDSPVEKWLNNVHEYARSKKCKR